MNPVASILSRHPALIIDGALATELERRGYDLKGDLWSARMLLDHPKAIWQLHYDYFQAGADCAITASYQATIEGFRARGLTANDAVEVIGRSVTLAIGARDAFWADAANRAGRSKPLVAASVGPYGAFLADGSEYRGNYGLSESDLRAFHRPRMKALIDAGPDVLACETIPCLTEARALAAVLSEFPSVTAWFSFSARDATHVSEGQPFADCVREMERHPQIAAVGINCTAPRLIVSLIQEATAATTKPVLVYPNSGESYDPTTQAWSGAASEAFGERTRAWYDAGARLIGGCCRTTPEDIRALSRWVRAASPDRTPAR
jgi:homocysteine S-methyltransferase